MPCRSCKVPNTLLGVAVFHAVIWIAFGSERVLFAQTVASVHGGQTTIARSIIAAFCGPASVVVFFVLSGFVLAKSLRKETLGFATYISYCVKRVMRIFPALAFSIAVALTYLLVFYPGYREFSTASVWLNWWYKDPVRLFDVVKNLAMMSASLNSNAWTLRIEMLASLALPFVVAIMGRRGIVRSLAAVAVCFAWAAYTGDNASAPSEFSHYAYMFVLGVALEKHIDQITKIPRLLSAMLVVASLAAMVVVNAFWPLVHFLYGDAVIALSSAILILVIVVDRNARFLSILDTRAVRYLGRISYSFYILHFVLLYGVANFALRYAPEETLVRYPLIACAVVGALSIAITLPIASISYRFVEQPMTLAGKRIADMRFFRVKSV
ncbi:MULTISPECIES: acyltransferase family protein [Ralstonia solanacearum species complex]|uniref:Integral membrane acetyltransferase n=1 Tax=Ralstonia solanacearum (strain UW551) TaxID=342110 RepID=A0AB33V6Q6_RALSU|nr:acyltransferase [Ralstonia solanacearum]EAP70555.1 integral membrane acetyltransferase [Ralstonia solanacearum UW551]ALF88511.1 O-acetyltransferase OatA [Ralstonia solanacearum]ATI27959.1 acyltransferase [Ralstonia solanacearum]KEI31463.1 transferase [Ralstonia solanacearum]KLT21383.1 transferase [Ralstonia solanacearum]